MPNRRRIFISKAHLEKLAYDHGVPIELSSDYAFLPLNGDLFVAILAPFHDGGTW